jgi:hypothetical protein
MELNYIQDGIDAVVIDNFYPEKHLKDVISECKKLIPKMLKPEHTGGALNETNEFYIKQNRGGFIDSNSKIFLYTSDVTTSEKLQNNLTKFNPMWKLYPTMNTASTLVSYYADSDYYDKHIDFGLFTILTWVNNEPRKFSGGDLTLYSVFNNTSATVEYRNNRSVIFLSCTPHSVSPVKQLDGFNEGDGRFCITHFVGYVQPPKPEKIK